MVSPSNAAFCGGITADALMSKSFAPIRWIVPGYLVEGMTILAGAPKVGKSWLALNLLVAVASGGCALGSELCEGGDVLGLMLEDNQRRLQRRLRQMDAKCCERLTLATECPTLDDGCITSIEDWIEEVKSPRLIVIDVFARVKGEKGGKENDYQADYRQAALLQALASNHGVAIVLIHHTRKALADDPFDEVSGTRGLTAAADSVLVLKSIGGQPVLYGRGRDLEEMETALQFDSQSGTWSTLGDASHMAGTIERREIQDILIRSNVPMSPTSVAQAAGKSRQNVQNMLLKMFLEGKVQKQGRGLYVPVSSVSRTS